MRFSTSKSPDLWRAARRPNARIKGRDTVKRGRWSRSHIFGICKFCNGLSIRGICQCCGTYAVCQRCGRVRQNDGSWRKVYAAPTGATHGICLACTRQHYREYSHHVIAS
jgi:hypothetical protein